MVFSGPLGLSHVLCSLNVWHFRVFYLGAIDCLCLGEHRGTCAEESSRKQNARRRFEGGVVAHISGITFLDLKWPKIGKCQKL